MASLRNDSSSSNSGSANASETIAYVPSASGTLPSKSVSADLSDTCGCHASGVARTCYECLNTKLGDGQSCAINPYGSCMYSASALNYQVYFNATYYAATMTNYSDIHHGNEFFWSANATYCSSDDATCTGCRAKWVDAFQNQSLHSNFSCFGVGGCVCTAYCELRQTANFPVRNYSTGAESCDPQSDDTDTLNQYVQQYLMRIGSIVALLTGALLVVIGVRQFMTQFHKRQHERRMRERRQAIRRQRDETSRFGLVLTLEGWNGYREQLIEREQESLGIKSEPLLTEVPTRVVIAEDEGFRPASPSQLSRQQLQHSSQEN